MPAVASMHHAVLLVSVVTVLLPTSSVYQSVSGEVKTQSVRSEKASAAMNEFRGSTRSFLAVQGGLSSLSDHNNIENTLKV